MSFSSSHSINSSLHQEHQDYSTPDIPVAYVPAADNEDAMSDISGELSATVSRQHSLAVARTETTKSLKEIGISDQLPPTDPNRPQNIEAPIFPEEYTLETETGLVPVHTLKEIGRTPTNISSAIKSRHSKAEEAESEEDSSSSTDKKESEQDFGRVGSASQAHHGANELPDDAEFVTFLIGDKENPHNWPAPIRWLYTIILSCVVISVAYGSSCVTGCLGLIEDKYNVSQEVAILTCSLMVIGFSVGPLIWSPMSEQYGRKPAYFVSLALYTIFNIPCALAPNIGTVLVCRFLCGVFASSGLCLVGGSIADMFPTETRGEAIAYFAAAPYAGPVFGPLVTGFINIGSGRLDLVFWVNMAFGGAMWIAASLIPETYAPVILKKRAAKMRKDTGNDKIMTEQEASKMSFSEMIQTVLYRPLMFVVTEPVLDLMCFYVCLIYSLLYAFFFAYPVVFGDLYDYNDMYIGMMLIPIIIGAGFALLTTPVLEKYYVKMTKRRQPTPEDRLIGAMVGAPFPVFALFILGATSFKQVIWVGPASSGLAFGYGMVLIYYSINNYIIDTYAKYAASALATKVFLRSAGGAAFPLFTIQMYHKLGLQWASWLLAFISLAMVAIPFGFYKYGAYLRGKLCKADYSEF